MSDLAISVAEFRDLVSTLSEPELWVADAFSFKRIDVPAAIEDCGTPFESPGARFSDAVVGADRGAYVRLSAESVATTVCEAELRYHDGVVRRTLKVRVEIPEPLIITVTETIGTHDTALEEIIPRQTTGRFREAGVAQLDRHAKIVTADAGYCSILGLDPNNPIGANSFDRVHPDDVRHLSVILSEAARNPAQLAHTQLRTGSAADGWRIVEWLAVVTQAETENPVLMISLLDMNDDVLASGRADEDELTGLLNRAGFQAVLEEIDGPSALAFIDIDRFKEVNDRFGHPFGDQVLKTIASRLHAAVRHGEVVGRIHGDEFVALIPRVESEDTAHRITQRLVSSLDEPIEVGGHRFTITASGGYTLLSPGQSVSEVMHRADAAMYRAKQQAGISVAPFDRALIVDRDLRARAIELLPDIFEDGSGLFFEFQPLLRTATRTVLGVEALLRWELDDGTRIPPPIALGLFDSRGLIERFTRWSIDRTVESLAMIDGWNMAPLQIGLNMSPSQLALPNLSEWLLEAVQTANAEPRRIVIEVTETEALSENHAAHQAAASLLEQGFLVSLDDFGAGWSSLDQLAATPAHSLKIDRRLVSTLHNPRVTTVLRSLKTITDELKMAMVVEGVETPEQLHFFHELGAAAVQGWLLGRSVPLSELQAAVDSAEQIAVQHLGPALSSAPLSSAPLSSAE